jgi:hypothetical protein
MQRQPALWEHGLTGEHGETALRPRCADTNTSTTQLPAVYGRRIFFSRADARTHLAFFPVGPELFWQQPIESSQHAQGALLPCAFRHIATKPAPDTAT